VDGALREYISNQADLLGAIRLPNDAFKKNANTEVTTDIVMLRKRLPGELPNGPAWKELVEITNSRARRFRERILRRAPGDDAGRDAAGGPDVCAQRTDAGGQRRPLAEQLPKHRPAAARCVQAGDAPGQSRPTMEQSFPAPEHIKPNAYAIVNEQLAIRDGDTCMS
jgi:hypothetical protein